MGSLGLQSRSVCGQCSKPHRVLKAHSGDSMIVDQLRRDLRDMIALVAGTVELVGARLARTVGSGQGTGTVGRATRDLVHFSQSREGVGQADEDHPVMK